MKCNFASEDREGRVCWITSCPQQKLEIVSAAGPSHEMCAGNWWLYLKWVDKKNECSNAVICLREGMLLRCQVCNFSLLKLLEENRDVICYCFWLPIIEQTPVYCDLVVTDWASMKFMVKSASYIV